MIFKQGELIKTLYFNDDSAITVGVGNIDKIIVVMESGQMAGVPWLEVWRNGQPESKWNAALIAGVAYIKEAL